MSNAVAFVRTKRPAESATPPVWAALGTLLAAFGVEPVKAFAIAGALAVWVPAAVTAYKARKS